MRSGPVLVVAAWPPELARLRRVLTRGLLAGAGVELRAVGVGLVAAAIGASAAIERVKPRAVVLVGTAGRYRTARRTQAWAIGDAAIVDRIHLASAAVATAAGYFPGPMPVELASDGRLVAGLAGGNSLRVAAVACPLAITSSAALSARIATKTNTALESLEAFAVAAAAQAARVPFAAVLGIANDVGPRAHTQWKAHGAAAAAAACDVVAGWLTAPSRRPPRRR